MPVTQTFHDEDTLTLTIIAEFAAPPERIWQIYADPRQLEQIWGPPTYPATVVDHSLTPGGRVTYYMTSPEGERYHGLWSVTDVAEPKSFGFHDYFADAEFNVDENLPPSHCVYTFTAVEAGTRAEYIGTFESAEDLRKVIEMGIIEGTSGALGQIDELLAREK